MELIPEWRKVLRYGWSIRLILLAGILSGLEVILPMCTDMLPSKLFAGLSVIITAGAFVARVIAQPKMDSK